MNEAVYKSIEQYWIARAQVAEAERDALAEKLERAVEALEPHEALAKKLSADAPEWGPFDTVTAQVSILYLRDVSATLAAIKEGGA